MWKKKELNSTALCVVGIRNSYHLISILTCRIKFIIIHYHYLSNSISLIRTMNSCVMQIKLISNYF